MTSTNIHIGFSDQRNSSKVLKPPGGGSSDIFGASSGNNHASAMPRSAAKNHMVSNIFGAPENRHGNSEGRRNGNIDSHNRLFGEVDRPQAQSKNHFKSNIPIGGDATDAPVANGKPNGHSANGNGHAIANGNGKVSNGDSSSATVNGNGAKNDGNPVTGEGYKPPSAEINTTVPSLNGAKQIINKNRVPPGGFSSGLW